MTVYRITLLLIMSMKVLGNSTTSKAPGAKAMIIAANPTGVGLTSLKTGGLTTLTRSSWTNFTRKALTNSTGLKTVTKNSLPKFFRRRGLRRANEEPEEPQMPAPINLRKSKHKKSRSTSSSSGEKKNDNAIGGMESKESLEMTEDTSTSASSEKYDKKMKHEPKSTKERKGWRKWHRKCTRCPEDEKMKWRDPKIQWVCGAYQRARRSFKSMCMMHYRNCQDGTMFTFLHMHRCANSSSDDPEPHGQHFFYDYLAVLSGDTTDSKMEEDDEESSGPAFVPSSSSSESSSIHKQFK